MTVATYRPVNVFDQFQREAQQLFAQQRVSQNWSPAVDIREFDDRFVLRADVPGVAIGGIDITVENNVLSVTGERAAPQAKAQEGESLAEEGQVHRVERRYGAFSRQFRLPETVDVEGVVASGDNGVLEISLPKAQRLQPRKISVTAG